MNLSLIVWADFSWFDFSTVCLLHFVAMLGITYKRDNSLVWACEDIGKYELNPNNWTSHQTPVLAMDLGVLYLVLLIEKLIIQDLFYYYQNIKNTKITSDFILPHGYQAPILSYNKASLMAKIKLLKSHINIGWSNLFNDLTTLRRLRLQSKFLESWDLNNILRAPGGF